MKYKVSLLPESHKKRLNGKKKIEKIRSTALVVLLVLLAFMILVMATKMYSEKKLSQAMALDNEYAAKVTELEQYRDINAKLQAKIALLDKVKVEQPYLYEFIVNIGNAEHPGITLTDITCTDWKYTRQCVINGTCDTREQYLVYEEALKKVEGVGSVVCQSYTTGIGSEDGRAIFSMTVTVSGGKEVPTTAAPVTESTTAEAE